MKNRADAQIVRPEDRSERLAKNGYAGIKVIISFLNYGTKNQR